MKNNEQTILHHIHPRRLSTKREKITLRFYHWTQNISTGDVWHIMSNDRASESEIADYI